MNFAYPAFLGFLGLLAIPLIIHLFNFKKYKRLLFSDIRFLKDIQEKTKKQSQLKHLLVLCCRILAFVFLVFAFAQPFSGDKEKNSPNQATLLYIDNSFSMDALSKDGKLFDLAKEKAKEIVVSSEDNMRFQILTNEFSIISQRLCTKEEALEQIENITTFPISRTAKDIIGRENELIKNNAAISFNCIHLSDFQKNYFNYENLKFDHELSLVPLLPQTLSNISIDSVWFNNPLHIVNGTENLFFRISNHDKTQERAVTLQLKLNDQQKSVTTITLPAGATVDSSFIFNNNLKGIINGKLILNDEQVLFDDVFYFTYKILTNIKVACINNFAKITDTTNYAVKNIFSSDNYYHFKSFTLQNIDYSEIKNHDFIILNQLQELSSGLALEIEKYLSSGGSVCIIPSINSSLQSYNTFLSQINFGQLSKLDTSRIPATRPDISQPFYSGIFERKPNEMDVPVIRKHYILLSDSRNLSQTILGLKNGDALISSTIYKKGKCYLITSPFNQESGNLTQHALIVPILLRMGELCLNSGRIYYTFGKDEGFETKPVDMETDNVFKFNLAGQSDSYIPEFRNDGNLIQVFFNNEIEIAGNYYLEFNKNNIDGTSLNYDRKESVLILATLNELTGQLEKSQIKKYKLFDKSITETKLTLATLVSGKKYWKQCIYIMLIFLIIESLILKFWKT